MSPSSRFYIPGLDSLRCFAFLCVFVNHTVPTEPLFYSAHHLPQVFAAISLCGSLGVDLFFVLSGYLITELLLREREQTGDVDVRAFYIRRILRIWPLYFLALTIAIVLSSAGRHSLQPSQITAFLLLAGNWACAWWGWPTSFICVLWSVSIEEQFYLLWVWSCASSGAQPS